MTQQGEDRLHQILIEENVTSVSELGAIQAQRDIMRSQRKGIWGWTWIILLITAGSLSTAIPLFALALLVLVGSVVAILFDYTMLFPWILGACAGGYIATIARLWFLSEHGRLGPYVGAASWFEVVSVDRYEKRGGCIPQAVRERIKKLDRHDDLLISIQYLCPVMTCGFAFVSIWNRATGEEAKRCIGIWNVSDAVNL